MLKSYLQYSKSIVPPSIDVVRDNLGNSRHILPFLDTLRRVIHPKYNNSQDSNISGGSWYHDLILTKLFNSIKEVASVFIRTRA
jgi:hypothetical protein